MASEFTSDECKFIRKIANDNGFVNFTIDVEKGSNLGENYTSTINKVIIEENERKLNLMVKSLIVKYEDPTDWLAIFVKREIYTYKTILPCLETQLDKIGLFLEYPKCYGILDEGQKKTIILEDMRVKGYRLFDRQKVMTQKHFIPIFQTYAKLHASSYSLKIDNPIKFKEIQDKIGPPHFSNLFLEYANIFQTLLSAVEEDKKLYEHVKNRKEFLDHYFEFTSAADDKYNVFIHGDNWCNNFLFKYENDDDTQSITDICLIDWQLAAVGSPICDLSYCFYANAINHQSLNLDQLLVEYHKSFHEASNTTNEIISLEEIRNQWKIHSVYGLIATTLIQQIMVVDGNKAPNISNERNTEAVINILVTPKSNKSECNRRLKNLVKFMYENNFL